MIGIIGYGRFGRLMAGYLATDFPVVVSTRSALDTASEPASITFASLQDACRQDIVVLSVPISALQGVLRHIAPLLKRDALVVDVSSVKMLPVGWMTSALPGSVAILATHPMFGPDSAADSLENHKIVLCPVRIGRQRFKKIADWLSSKGLVVIEATPEEHDRQIAVSLALTHFIGRSLAEFGADDLPIDTEGYKRLRHILGVVENDTWQLFRDMHTYNPHAGDIRAAFMAAVEKIDGRLTSVAD